MVDMVLLQQVSYIAGALGVCVAAIYYVMNLRISQKNQAFSLKTQELALKSQEQQLETRQVQLYMSLYQQINKKEIIRDFIEILNMEWKDYDDFEKKYGSDNNPESYALRHSVWYLLDGLGYLLKENLVTPTMMYQLIGLEVPWHWKKYRDIIVEARVRAKLVNMYEGFEYLSEAMSKMQLERDPNWSIPETLTRYVPDKGTPQ
jgi:hypothetical protein